jgi:hypothetical protein
VWKGYQRIHKGGWALESCPNNDLNPLCPTLLTPKEMLQGGFGDFYFYEIATAVDVDGFGFDNDERMQWKYDKKDSSRGSWQFGKSSPSTLVSIGDALVSIG